MTTREPAFPGLSRDNAASTRAITALDLRLGALVSTAFGIYEVTGFDAPYGLRRWNAPVKVTLVAVDVDENGEPKVVLDSTVDSLRLMPVTHYWPNADHSGPPVPLPERRFFSF